MMPTKRFLAAISYPGEHRPFVSEVAECLSKQLGREKLFFDTYYREELAVPDLDLVLQEIYRSQSLLVIPFLCTEYNKHWCRLEWKVMRAILAEHGRNGTIFPVRLDDQTVPGFEKTDGYIDARKITPAELAQMIVQRVLRLTTNSIREPVLAEPETIERRESDPLPGATSGDVTRAAKGRIAIAYKRNAQPDQQLLELVRNHLQSQGYSVFVDSQIPIGMEWAREIDAQIRSVDAIVILLSAAAAESEMLSYEIKLAQEAAQQRLGKPYLFPVRIQFLDKLPPELAGYLDRLQYFLWQGPDDDQRLLKELEQALRTPNPISSFRPPGGAMPLDSKLYVKRPTDNDLTGAVARHDQVILIKGARQMGKTSMMARGLQQARAGGAKVVLTDFQKLNKSDLESPESLFRALSIWIADQLNIKADPDEFWDDRRSPNVNFERYLRRQVFQEIDGPLVWGLDEVDRLFTCDFRSEVFGLFRAWVNERETDPNGPWSRLTQIITYATEPYLFITDPNQSPFNVGTRLELKDFTIAELADLNGRYAAPLRGEVEIDRFHQLLGGHPYLSNRGLYELSLQRYDLSKLESIAAKDEGPFGDHLRRMLFLLAQDDELCRAVRAVLDGKPGQSLECFHRLRSAGVMIGDSAAEASFRCQLYVTYFRTHLA